MGSTRTGTVCICNANVDTSKSFGALQAVVTNGLYLVLLSWSNDSTEQSPPTADGAAARGAAPRVSAVTRHGGVGPPVWGGRRGRAPFTPRCTSPRGSAEPELVPEGSKPPPRPPCLFSLPKAPRTFTARDSSPSALSPPAARGGRAVGRARLRSRTRGRPSRGHQVALCARLCTGRAVVTRRLRERSPTDARSRSAASGPLRDLGAGDGNTSLGSVTAYSCSARLLHS